MNQETGATFYAHSANEAGQYHALQDHLYGVANLAREFAAPFGGGEVAYYAGLWHDLGKFNPEFRAYLTGERTRGPEHKAVGTKLACRFFGRLGLLIQGHHGGLRANRDLAGWLDERGNVPAVDRALDWARAAIPDLEPAGRLRVPEYVRSETAAELWLRMVFSALVDADFLDTERHFHPEQQSARQPDGDMEILWRRFQQRHRMNTQGASGKVNTVRAEVYRACMDAAERRPGMFKLAVPTGGGKTLSAMGFALRHAATHGLERVIVAVPFTSITQQTAAVYREFLEEDPSAEPATVLEHHSMVDTPDDEEYDHRRAWTRLAAENWDAPVVVTTTVQLFHSLFSNRTGATRKLHRLANSVIILDEAQALPPELLDPILDALRQLADNYGTSVALSTATQPAFETIGAFADVEAEEMVPDHPRHFQELRRVEYEWRVDPALSWAEVTDVMKDSAQVLTVVNTKKDAMSLLGELEDEEALHLSTMLCGRHRERVIREVKRRLDRGEPCRVVSTQVVEAGVDLDFPVVLRAIGPLDGIIQAGGRCNRSGRLGMGRVVVFVPRDGAALPPGSYRMATDTTMMMLNAGIVDLDDPDTVAEYFRRLFQFIDTDREQVQPARRSFDYPEVAERFKMIDDATLEAVVTGYGAAEERERNIEAVARLQSGRGPSRSIIRSLRPWTVQIYRRQATSMISSGLLSEIIPGFYEWRGDYDSVIGIGGVTALDPDRLIF